MARFLVHGGKRLEGEVELSGSKNASSKMMIASLLTDEPCVLKRFPRIGDTEITAELCRSIGSGLSIEGDVKGYNSVLKIHTPNVRNCRVASLSRKNRIPILALGPLLSRKGEAEVPFLGGDKIGHRPIDMHLDALTALGAKIKINGESYYAEAPNGLRGAAVQLRFPSVGATENIILSSVLAKGRTLISNAAIEPEIIELVKMLQKMGAIIELGANRRIYIEGVERLRGVSHDILADRNEAVSFACLAVATGGRVKVKGAVQEHLITFLNALRKIGGEYLVEGDGIVFWRRKPLESIEIETDTHPGFMTDWQQPFLILLTQSKGMSVIHETIYEDRFGYVSDLNDMGADIKVFSKCLGELPCRFNGKGYYHSAVIHGPSNLKAKNLKVPDLRAGMAHLVAALIAEGESTIEGVEEIDRGYENIDSRLRQLGADIKRI